MPSNKILEEKKQVVESLAEKMKTAQAGVLVKYEGVNIGGSIKTRVAYNMIKDAINRSLIHDDTIIVEPTSGNQGIGLALVGAVMGYRVRIIMPDSVSVERRKLLAAYGAQIVLTPGAEGMTGSIAKANEIIAENPGSFMPRQFDNKANPAIHRSTTALEILQACDGKVDAFVAGVGTGGTLTGVGEVLKGQIPDCKIIAVEPFDSPLLSGGQAGPHKLQGIGANFIPSVLNREIIDEVMAIRWEDAGEMARNCAKSEGILIGISGGAALFAAIELSKRAEFSGKRIVVLLPDSGERYLSSWLFDKE